MSRITMQDVAVMSVQYVQYTFPYYLESMAKCSPLLPLGSQFLPGSFPKNR